MRRKPTSGGGSNGGGYNNQQRRRYPGSGSGEQRPQNGGHHHNGGNRPRKNYTANREKYLAQARDALASGDRVLAENYFQHADHCYRMMMEEGFNPNQQHTRSGQQPSAPSSDEQAQEMSVQLEEHIPENTSALPAFLTVPFVQNNPVSEEPPPVQSWEERDA